MRPELPIPTTVVLFGTVGTRIDSGYLGNPQDAIPFCNLVELAIFSASRDDETPMPTSHDISAFDLDSWVWVQRGDVPLLISAPHGGSVCPDQLPVRQASGRSGGGTGFVTARDVGTQELAEGLVATLQQLFHAPPYATIARIHRKYVDFNRPPELAYDEPSAAPVYNRYHEGLRTACREILQRFGCGLLIDLHGQMLNATCVFRGTHDGKTVSGLRDRFGEIAVNGPASLLGRLKSFGATVHPDPLAGPEQPGYRGGQIVKSYGSHQQGGIDAVQLEFGEHALKHEQRLETIHNLACAVTGFLRDYVSSDSRRQDATDAEPNNAG